MKLRRGLSAGCGSGVRSKWLCGAMKAKMTVAKNRRGTACALGPEIAGRGNRGTEFIANYCRREPEQVGYIPKNSTEERKAL